MAGASKLVLDFLMRRATMTSRQLPVPKLHIRRGKPAWPRQDRRCAGGTAMTVGVQALAAAPTRSRPPVVSPLRLATM